MKIRIQETGEIKDLIIRDKREVEWTYDLLGNAGISADENGTAELSQDNFEWWVDYINNYESDEKEISEIAITLDIEESEINDEINKELSFCTDMENEHDIKQEVIQEFKKKL